MCFARKIFVVFTVLGMLMFLAAPAVADWKPEDGHKMHFPQLPDPTGWDVNATYPKVLADDWTCSQTGWVKDIHFWGSWLGGLTGQINFFHLSIHANIAEGPNGYSMPGEELWYYEATHFPVVPIDPPTMQGWYDPNTGEYIPNDHRSYFQYNIILPETFWFWQEADTTYWLDISANVVAGPVKTMWGWKTSQNHHMDDAVWADFPAGGIPEWRELFNPITGESLDMAFVITPEPGTLVLLATAGLGLALLTWRRRRERR